MSNVVLEGVGQGPIHKAQALEEAARELKYKGQVELWNYLGEFNTAADIGKLVSKVWRLNGTLVAWLFLGCSF